MAAAVLYVKDLQKMRSFYESCFALFAAEAVDHEFCVLTSDYWELSLVMIPADVAATVIIGDPPERRTATPIKLAFDVESIDDLRTVIMANGGFLPPGESTWEFRGRHHLDCLDPEGNVVQLRQFASTGRG